MLASHRLLCSPSVTLWSSKTDSPHLPQSPAFSLSRHHHFELPNYRFPPIASQHLPFIPSPPLLSPVSLLQRWWAEHFSPFWPGFRPPCFLPGSVSKPSLVKSVLTKFHFDQVTPWSVTCDGFLLPRGSTLSLSRHSQPLRAAQGDLLFPHKLLVSARWFFKSGPDRSISSILLEVQILHQKLRAGAQLS